jgi:EcsC protein family
MMESNPLTPYEREQVTRIAAWKARRPGLLRRTIETVKWPFDRLFERLVPATRARVMLARVHRAADWEQNHHLVVRALGIGSIQELKSGPLEVCDGLVRKLRNLDREIVTSESLLANVGGLATELLELPAELILALRTVHDVAACYGYQLDCKQDETLVLAIIGLSLVNDPAERLRARRLIRELEEGKGTTRDRETLVRDAERKIEDEVGDDVVVEVIGSTLVEEKVEEGIPLLGAALGVILDNAFIQGIDEAAQLTFQERWLRDQGKIDEIAPAEAPVRTSASIGQGLSQAAYSTSYAVSFGVVFPAALIAAAGSTVLPGAAVDGLREGAAGAREDADRLVCRIQGREQSLLPQPR